jgi:hypothetical protein
MLYNPVIYIRSTVSAAFEMRNDRNEPEFKYTYTQHHLTITTGNSPETPTTC